MSEQGGIQQAVTEADYAATSGTGNANITITNYYYREEARVAPADSVITDGKLPCPYRGLFHFGPGDAEYFFGRESFVKRLFQAIQTRNFIPLLGASGSGKSSVVLAGLIPKLEQEQKDRWKFTHFRPGSDPFHALALALVPLYTTSLDDTEQIAQTRKLAGYLNDNTVPLSDVFAKIQQNHFNHRILLIADQFEEIYTQCSDHTVRNRFLNCLLASFQPFDSSSSSSTVLVTTMRADFLANALSYRPFADMLQNADVKLGAMNKVELTEVIEKPAKKLGVTFEVGLIERILNDIEVEPGNLPLLEFALTELWKKRTGKQLTHSAYEAIGQVKGALADYADDKYVKLTSKEQEQARRIFIQLVRPGEGTEDTRRRANRSELDEENWNLITRKEGLADSRLVVTNRNDSEHETVEVVHESLIQNWGQLRQWMNTDRGFRAWQERLRSSMNQWEELERNEDALLQSVLLAESEQWLKERLVELSLTEQEYIRQSVNLRDRLLKEEEERKQRELNQERKARKLAQTRNIILTLSVLALSALTVFAFSQQQQKEKQRIEAEKQRITALSSSSELLFDSRQEFEAILQGLQAGINFKKIGAVEESEIKNKLITTLESIIYRIREKNFISLKNGKIDDISFSPNNQIIASTSQDKIVRLWDLEGKLIKAIPHEHSVKNVNFHPKNDEIIVSLSDTLKFWNIVNGELLKSLSINNESFDKFVFSSDGLMLVLYSKVKINILRSDGSLVSIIKNSESGINDVNFSPDGKRIAVGCEDTAY
jgi:hypothetical protein